MQKITVKDKIRSILHEWRMQYPAQETHKLNCGRTGNMIYEELCKLNLETAAKQDVDNIIGNPSWTDTKCHECNKMVDKIIIFKIDDYYEIHTCKKCLQRAINLLEEE